MGSYERNKTLPDFHMLFTGTIQHQALTFRVVFNAVSVRHQRSTDIDFKWLDYNAGNRSVVRLLVAAR
jgi:hypothetical protein